MKFLSGLLTRRSSLSLALLLLLPLLLPYLACSPLLEREEAKPHDPPQSKRERDEISGESPSDSASSPDRSSDELGPPDGTATPSALPHHLLQAASHFDFTFAPYPDAALEVGEPVTFQIKILKKSNHTLLEPDRPFRVWFWMKMPGGDDHGPSQRGWLERVPPALESGRANHPSLLTQPGIFYHRDVIFNMPGTWEIHLQWGAKRDPLAEEAIAEFTL